MATDIMKLREKVLAAREIFDSAMSFHEAWKPTSFDESLKSRMGKSYATNTFNVVSVALRREMFLGLMCLWDKQPSAVNIKKIADAIDDQTIENFATDRAVLLGVTSDDVKVELRQQKNELYTYINKYIEGGPRYSSLQKLKTLRDKRLVHYDTDLGTVTTSNILDNEIESFFQDTKKIIHLLMSIVEGTSYNPEDTATVFRRHAAIFWASVRGERTEGHPNYRAPPVR